LSKKRHFFAKSFGENILKIITSTPGHVARTSKPSLGGFSAVHISVTIKTNQVPLALIIDCMACTCRYVMHEDKADNYIFRPRQKN
jgi:hypothetical protein